ncbi:AraC family transcriptional regulator [Actinospica sp. MGRD01-02]|uniref:AraC family transcriptional regulator n=1 Tax=Actinospica acidithermotolerans TaxID=2828514 RepID=A0A941INC8_9ACTN|nr:helix-turn-helix transcriptional regulator [Actinospica acidithermotolerans]MBR7830908.1 AraC family transcriptional regulator [Actinospica acidithermotolerans]
MVDSGQSEIVGLTYDNPDRPRLGLEAMTFAQLRARTKAHIAASPIRADFHQLTVIRSGVASAAVDFVPYACGPGTVLHVRPGQVQRLPAGANGRLTELDAVVLLFTADFPPRTGSVATLLDLEFGPAAVTTDGAEADALHRAAAEILAEYRLLDTRRANPVRLSVGVLRHLTTAMLLRVARAQQPSGDDHANEVFRAFRAAVEQSFTVTRDVQVYASRLGYAPRTLTRACLAATGTSAKQFLDARVALEAKRLLVHTDLNIASIGRAVGFSEATNFGKFFMREVGMTPGAFRAAQ